MKNQATKKSKSSKIKKSTQAKTLKASSGKAQMKPEKSVLKKLGKGLEDISNLFLSTADKPSLQSKKTKANTTKIKDLKQKQVKAESKQAKGRLKSSVEKTAPKKKKSLLKFKKMDESNFSDYKKKQKKIEVVRRSMAEKSEKNEKNTGKSGKNIDSTKPNGKSKSPLRQKTSLRPISELKSLLKGKKSKTTEMNLNVQPEQIVEESKFFTGPTQVQPQIQDRQLYELPVGYGDTLIVIQVRDPYWIHAYWEVSQERLTALHRDLGRALQSAKRVLRIYDITGVLFDGSNANKFFDIQINDYANNWYINIGEPGRSHCVDIGYVLANGQFIVLARSNFITTPIDGPSKVTDEEWMIVEDDFNRLYGLSAGLGIGLSSMELRKRITQRIRNLSSGLISSPGARGKMPTGKFWLVVNTELIVYGATEPGAKVSIDGKPITLNKDGTFSLRFALPDGEQSIPVKAVSKDKLYERQITPIVRKRTE